MSGSRVNNQTKRKPSFRSFRWYLWLAIIPLVFSAIAFVLLTRTGGPAVSDHSGSPRVAIVDQLYNLQPNGDFINRVTNELKNNSYQVDLYQGNEVTVDFYRQLPGYNYKLIIFRAHAGLLGSEGKAIPRTCLFSNEPYSEVAHISEQLSDQLAKARINADHPWVFGIGDRFVTQSMTGKFNDTVIIMMGCSTLYIDDLARSFIEKGSAAYIGWDASVGLDYVDGATADLVRGLCSNKLSIEKAVDGVIRKDGIDPTWGARLKYYPPLSGEETLLTVSK